VPRRHKKISTEYVLDHLFFPTTGGLYAIENIVTGGWYVGSTVNLRKRWILHRTLLRAGQHHSPYLQNSWNKHGEEVFRFVPIHVTDDKEEWVRLEQHFLDTLKPPYNVSPTANSNAGIKRSEETRARMRAANSRPEKVARFVEMGKKPKSEAHRARIALAHTGKRASEATKAKLRAVWAERKKATP
jgi:group I intron endonuclease